MSSFDRQLEKELEKLKKKKKDTVTPQKSKTNSFDEQLEEELASLKKTGKNSGKDTGKYSDFSVSTTEDIAPVRTHGGASGKFGSSTDDAKKDDDKKWYESGHFADGWDFGDLTKTILGVKEDSASLKDLTVNSIKKGYYNSRYGEETYKAMSGQSNDKETYKKLLQGEDYQFTPGNKFAEGVSGAFELIGQMGRQFTDPSNYALALGAGGAAAIAGQAGPQVLLPEEIVTVPVAATAGWAAGVAGQTYKIEAGHAYNEMRELGISDELAKTVALIVGSGNAALEAFQVDELFDAYKVLNKTGAKKTVLNRILKELADRGIDVATETAQEVAQEGITITGAQVANKLDKGEWAYSAGDVTERLWDTAQSSALSFGMMNVPATAKNITSIAVDQKKESGLSQKESTLSQDEQTILDKVIEEKIAEQEKDGKQLTTKQKSDIEEKVRSDLEKGYISAEKIEEIFGGEKYDAFRTALSELSNSDDYKAYKKAEEEEASIRKEFDTLVKMKQGEMTGEQIYHRDDLKKILDESKVSELKSKVTPAAQNVMNLRDQMRSEVMERVKDTRLAESYRELERSKQKFTADVSKYKSEYAKKTVQNFIDSGLAVNTNEWHEKVDWLAQIAESRELVFKLADNNTLKITVEGYDPSNSTLNAFIDQKTGEVTLNMDSKEATRIVAGHEVSHTFEKAKSFKKLQDIIFNHAIQKEGLENFNKRLQDMEDLYRGKENTTPERELTAQLLGEYMFTDADFISNLATQNRNVFERIYNELKYLYKIATAGSKEARELEQAKRMFDKVWRESLKNKENSGESTKYSLENGNKSKYNKRSRYSETETLFMSWENGSAPVGEVKKFSRFGKIRYYEKTESGSVELSKRQFIERNNVYAENIDRRAERGFSEAYDHDENTQRGSSGDYFSNRDTSGDAAVFGQTIREKLPDVSRGSESSTLRDGTGNAGINQSEYIEEASAEEQDASFVTFSNDYATIRNYMKEGDVGEKTDSIDFSLSKAVEETKDLVALHNLTEDKLMKSLELGGLPMPSLAITKADIPHSNFGEITLVFGRDTIDPKKNKKNKVYSADAWTPVFPRTEYEADSKVANRVSQKLSELGSKIDDHFRRDLNRVSHGFESYLNSDGGEEGLIQRVMDNDGMKAAYLEDQGKHIDKVTKQEEAPKDYNPANADKYQKIMDILGVTTAEEIGKVNLRDAIENHGAELEAVYPGMTKTAMRMGRLLGVVESYIKNKDIGTVYQTVTDTQATQKALNDALDAEGYKAWVRNLFSGIVKDSGIYNNKDIFTPSGNRRSFKQTHLPVTLENIVKAMASQNDGKSKNVSGFNGVKTLRAATAETFKSVEEMHQKKGRLQNLTQEQFEAITNDLQTRLYKVMEAIDNESGQIGGSNPFIRMDSIGETLTEIGESGKFGVADIQRVFNEYSRNISDDTALEVKQLLYDVAQMPVNIFEAKPQRVVNFDEAKVFVIPNNANTKLKQELLNRGYSIAEYDPNVEGDRQKVVNQFEEYQFSLSNVGKESYIPANDAPLNKFKYKEGIDEFAPVAENATVPEVGDENTPTEELFPDDIAPVHVDLDNLLAQQSEIRGALEAAVSMGDTNTMSMLTQEYENVTAKIRELEAQEAARVNSIDDANAPPEMDAPYFGDSDPATVENPFDDRDWYKVGNQKVKAYMYENPEVKPFFQDEALALMTELRDTTKGEKFYSEEAFMVGGNEEAWTGVKRHTSKSIETLLDDWGMSYADIEKGLNAIIEDNGAENIAAAKKIEFMLNDRLLNGYTDFYSNSFVSPNQEYINLLEEMQINEYSEEAFAKFMETADQYAPFAEDDIAPVAQPVAPAKTAKEEYVAVTPKRTKEPKMVRVDAPFDQKTANILTEEPKVQKKNNGLWSMVKENVLDNGMVFEDLALKTKNRDLQAKWNFIRYSQSRAQKLIGEGTDSVTALNTVREEVEKSGKLDKFQEYMHHWLNVDRMTLENRFEDTPNKAVFGDSVTADMSRAIAVKLGRENPEFRLWSQELYRYNNYLRELMVENGVISQETAELWAEMYPHYIPVRRIDDAGLDINVPLDTRKTGVNAPIKRATGGSSDILPMFDTMAQRTLQTYKAIAKNSFGVELKNTLGTTIATEKTDVDGVIDGMDYHEELLQEGKKGNLPTFTVFENGEKVTFEITDEMYNAMKPASDLMSYTNKVTNTISNFHRGLLTEYNPVFMATNAIKDSQDILINSQHPAKTYANLPRAASELARNGKWFREYMENGGEDNSYFDSDTNSFNTEEKGIKKLLGIPPLSWISKANNFIERMPRLAEYIASREAGRSIEVSMLDAARVTTNFAAGGKLTKFANRNGATFLNASVQGAVQQARNIREAKANGLKGWAQLAGKFAVAGLPAILLNGLMWDDDEDYEELSDYVKQNYYIVGKYGDGKFVRIPKGRTVAVIQNAVEQVMNAATGDDEVDLKSFLELAISNLAPNNPIENNIIAPIIQVKKNETWYGEDLVPTRLQDLPAAEQFDESTDAISKWLGEKLNLSPYKINYLLDQYSGGVGDTILPMLTPEAESGDDSFVGKILAPFKSKFTTDSVMNNQNVSDFYDTKDELTTNAKASGATDEDILKNKYINSINAELSELYAKKREIQNSHYSDSLKYSMLRNVQKQIVDLTKESLDTYNTVSIDGEYATVGDRYFKKNDDGEWQKMSEEQVAKHKATSAAGDSFYATDGKNHYRYYVKEGETEGEWRKITADQFDKQIEVTRSLDISAAEYWSKKEEYDYAYDNPESYAVAKSVGGYDAYKTYSAELYDIKADKDENGKSISGSRKEKVIDYINGLDADYYTKIILYKSEYTSDDTYNEEIVEYLNSRDDISYQEMVTILKKLGFTVSKDGKTVTW